MERFVPRAETEVNHRSGPYRTSAPDAESVIETQDYFPPSGQVKRMVNANWQSDNLPISKPQIWEGKQSNSAVNLELYPNSNSLFMGTFKYIFAFSCIYVFLSVPLPLSAYDCCTFCPIEGDLII